MTPPYTDETLVRNLVSRHDGEYEGTAGSVDQSSLLSAIAAAQQVIDSKLGRLYVTPFDPVPELIRDLATTLAACDLDLTFREVRDYQSELNPIRLRYKQAMELLTELAKGDAVIPGYEPPDGGELPPDNPNDPGSIVGVFNADLNAIRACGCSGSCGHYRSYSNWGQF